MKNEVKKIVEDKFGVELIKKISEEKHILTHQHIFANFYEVELANLSTDFELSFLKVKNEDVYKYPISRLIHRYLEQK